MKLRSLSLLLLTPFLTGCLKAELDYNAMYWNIVSDFQSKIEEDKNCDIDFLGDSITEKYDVNKYYPEYKVANRGISGDTTSMMIYRLDISAVLLEPKVISLLIGTNNLDTCMDHYETILSCFSEQIPDTKVAVISILPRRGDSECQKIKENNIEIKSLAEKYGYTYVDLYDKFTKDNKVNESLFKDGLHPNEKGYQLLTDNLKPVFANWLD